ncbi:DUF2897 family protein [Shewanella insulae]|uniref:DUF2897 family protein n=1 Tax=Shewanella insulae TaxID=2681496 RepID=UPI001EFC5D62|nr:DUF2897 family protein [Shewanella insulae]MCG9738934.1 DUF2897 family protein [Shewanella insulae]
MSSLEVWLIIILVLGVIASNLAVLKYSNKFKLPPFGKPQQKQHTAKGENQTENQTENQSEDRAENQAKSQGVKQKADSSNRPDEDKP